MHLSQDNENKIGTIKQEMVEKKKAVDELNHQHQVSSTHDMFTSSKLADNAPEKKEGKPRRCKSSEGIRKKSEHASGEVR